MCKTKKRESLEETMVEIETEYNRKNPSPLYKYSKYENGKGTMMTIEGTKKSQYFG